MKGKKIHTSISNDYFLKRLKSTFKKKLFTSQDPFTLKSGTYLKKLFPNSKFLFMVRDGRATVHSIITRKVTITGFDLKSYRQSLTKWNSAISAMNDQCEELGPNYCLKVYYEQLILHPRTWLTKILKFLDLPWTEEVMHHEKQINKPHGISLSKVERSSDQVNNFFLIFVLI